MLMDLRHPSIVRVFYDWAEQNDGWTDHYVIMEFLSGLTLHELIRREAPMPFDERARDIVFSIGAAVAYLHEQDIIHRDIKPENFRLSQGHFKLLDFDTAFCPSCRGLVSQDGMPVGTPEYMSPEQARGASDIDARADVYSFGMLMYEMLTGTVPFTGAPSRVLLDQIETAPHSPRVLQPGIPGPVAEIIMMALQKDRERRFRTIPAMLTALQEASRI
jgi:serine/threonine-protein kinase